MFLYKDLMRARYAAFAGDLALAPLPTAAPDPNTDEPDFTLFAWAGTHDLGDYACPALGEVAKALAANRHQAHALICLGEFARHNGLDAYPLDQRPPAAELGGAAAQFPGTLLTEQRAPRSGVLLLKGLAPPKGQCEPDSPLEGTG